MDRTSDAADTSAQDPRRSRCFVLFVAVLVTMFVVTPVTRWNPQSDDFGARWGSDSGPDRDQTG